MREQRGPQRRASLALFLALALSGLAVASEGQAIEVKGPIQLDGAASLDLQGAALVLRDPGTDAFGDVQMELEAGVARVTVVRIEDMCVGPSRVADVALPAGLDRPTRLAEALDVLPELGVTHAAAPALEPVRAAAEPLLARADAATAPLLMAQASPEDLLRDGCTSTDPGQPRDEVFNVANLAMHVQPMDPSYLVAWSRPGEDQAPGTGASASFRGRGAEVDVLTEPQSVAAVPSSSFGRGTPEILLDEGLVAVHAPGGLGTFGGQGKLLVWGAHAVLTGLYDDGRDFSRDFTLGERREPTGPVGPERRIQEFLVVELIEARGTYHSPAAMAVYGQTLRGDLDGFLRAPEARGELTRDGAAQSLDGGPLTLPGPLRFFLQGKEGDEGTMLLSLRGAAAPPPAPLEQHTVTEDGPDSAARAAMGIGAVTAAAGLLAWFWPTLKFLLAPLYTRIPTDSVLLHDAREKIYRLIKAEPGIHAHEVASRLTLGWGTTVYHLKLLEKNSLIVSRSGGRYKRFFVTGDARIQHQDAVALLRNTTSRSIAGAIATRPGLIQKEVCQALGLSPSLASWHLQRLEASGLVSAERLGRTVRYAPGPAWHELQLLNLPPSGPSPAAAPASAL